MRDRPPRPTWSARCTHPPTVSFFFAFDDEYDHATDMYSTGLPFVYLLQSRLFGCELFFPLLFNQLSQRLYQ